ncbi:unnamed protein product [Boreogadus saida]
MNHRLRYEALKTQGSKHHLQADHPEGSSLTYRLTILRAPGWSSLPSSSTLLMVKIQERGVLSSCDVCSEQRKIEAKRLLCTLNSQRSKDLIRDMI